MTEFMIRKPTGKLIRQAQELYEREFRRARKAGRPTEAEVKASTSVETLARRDSLWRFIAEGRRRLSDKSIHAEEAGQLAGDVRRARDEVLELSAPERETAEAVAMQKEFEYLLVNCVVDRAAGKRAFSSLDDYLRRATEPLAISSAQALARAYYGIQDLPEDIKE